MTFENRSLLFAKIGFLAVLTMLIVFAGNANSTSHTQTVEIKGGR